ncbi:MAG: tetratricopeptide repeat protein [Streptosporangiaceae bacterium]|jgi:hypothetical protein
MLNDLGMAFGLQRKEQAVGCFEEALAIYREIGDSRGETRAANYVAQAYLRLLIGVVVPAGTEASASPGRYQPDRPGLSTNPSGGTVGPPLNRN